MSNLDNINNITGILQSRFREDHINPLKCDFQNDPKIDNPLIFQNYLSNKTKQEKVSQEITPPS